MGRKRKEMQETTGKTSLDSMTQTHGKLEKFQYSTLDQIWGDTGLSKYNTMDIEVYKRSLAEMTKADLRTHATKFGIIPTDNRDLLERKLVSEFAKHTAKFNRPQDPPSRTAVPNSEALKILAEGK